MHFYIVSRCRNPSASSTKGNKHECHTRKDHDRTCRRRSLAFRLASNKDCTAEPKAKWQSDKEVQASLEKQGYSVKRVKAEGCRYEAKTTDRDGKEVKLILKPVDGKPVLAE